MAMQRIEDMSVLDMEATFGDYFESTPKQKEPLVGRLVVSEAFTQKVREGLPAEYGCFRNGAPVIMIGESK
ncbi:hypothetical protein HYP66_gp181 [Salmonella phage S118]|uniref:Uncharacterized protein n=2 Tax=Kuttervirus TaxID=2169536 RepID=A0A2Z5HPB7_9CAUD|nr:hypothetical protein HYP66_gp181 [Salmonella phage S118]YP_009889114.1 hypothetical protein HYQ37_gp181 [Salmonella phage pertopsoe]AXC41112.1 hypothetical protein [Salmonella phage S118]QIO03386.1 hypothetical protein pertopsoe_181 [Salmonella phage pertopsoe]CAB5508777.1 hypothetical protein [Salmonella phage Se_EM4]